MPSRIGIDRSTRLRGTFLAFLCLSTACDPYGSNVTVDVAAVTDLKDTTPYVEVSQTDNEAPGNDLQVLDVSEDSFVTPDDTSENEDLQLEDSLTDVEPVDVAATDATEIISDGFECPEGALCELKYNYACKEGRCNAQGACVVTAIPGCCLSTADCQEIPLGPCEDVQCVSQECKATPIPGCCLNDADCTTVLSCAISSCDTDTARCIQCPGDCPCTKNFNVQTKSFDKPTLSANGFTSTDYGSNDNVRWQVDNYRFFKPPSSIYLGDPSCRTYYNGLLTDECEPVTAGQDATAIRVILYSPAINLANSDGNAGTAVLFWYWSDVEPDLGLGIAEPDVLRAYADILNGTGVKWPVTTTLKTGKNTFGKWQPMAIDLSAFTNNLLRLRFEFDTFDGQLNNYEGIYIDEFQVVDKCPGGCCEVDEDCPYSGDPCTKPVCLPFSTGPGSICTEAPIEENCQPCATPSDCEDDNPCTTNTCTEKGVCDIQVFCCYATTLFETGFEEGLGGWSISDTNGDDNVFWQTTQTAASEGQSCAWFGDAETATYQSETAVKGTMVSPFIELPTDFADGGQLTLNFDVLLDTEWDGFFYLNPVGLDRMSVELLGVGAPKEIWSSDEINGTTEGVWINQSINLTTWAGKTVQLRRTFDSGDSNANDHAGAMLDNLSVGRTCP